MIYKLEMTDGYSEPVIIRVNDNMYMRDIAEYVCDYYGLEKGRSRIAVSGADAEVFNADMMRLRYMDLNIGDEMVVTSGWSRVRIRVKGVSL